MDMIELLAGSVGIEAIVTNVAEMRIRNMDDQFLDEFNGRFDHIITFFIPVVMVKPMDNIGLLIVTDDAAFSDAGPAGITHIVGDARIDVIAMVFVFKFFIFFLGPGMDVKSFRMIFIQDRFSALERRADFFFDEAKQFVLEGLSQFGEIEMGEELEGIFIRGIDQFRNEGMDMRIPFEITAKGMEGGDHAKMIDMAVVLEGIVRELDAFSPELADEGALTRAETVLRAAMKRILRLDLSLRNQFLRRSGMVKTICLCLVSRQKEAALTESCLAYLMPQELQKREWQCLWTAVKLSQ